MCGLSRFGGSMRKIDRKLILRMLTGPGLLIGALLYLYWRTR